MSKKGQKNGKKSESLTDDDRQAWENVLKTVRPYKRKAPQKEALTPPAAPSAAPKTAPPLLSSRTPPGKGFDRSTETKMKRGQLPIEGRLDLHGMTQEKARRSLQDFIRRAARDGKRNLLIITGKGAGVLKRMLPLWLEEGDLRHSVLAMSEAQPKDGGSGAFYVRLRKPAG